MIIFYKIHVFIYQTLRENTYYVFVSKYIKLFRTVENIYIYTYYTYTYIANPNE